MIGLMRCFIPDNIFVNVTVFMDVYTSIYIDGSF